MKHKDIIKKDLLRATGNYMVHIFKIEEFEKNFRIGKEHLGEDEFEDELFCNDEYIKLMDESSKLKAEAYKQMIDAKRYPLDVMAGTQKEILEIMKWSVASDKKTFSKSLDKILEREFLLQEKNIKQRFEQIEGLFVARKTSKRIDELYGQAINCYIFYGNFDACCVICRGIIERTLREMCEQKFKVTDSCERFTLTQLIDRCSRYKILKEESKTLADDIKERGDKSIHSKQAAKEADAISSIKDTQKFLRSI